MSDTDRMQEDVASIAGLLTDPTRSVMLLQLLGGRALPAGELAAAANVTAQTASGHLAKLIGAQLLRVEQQGRHRYYRLAGTEVADVLEALLVLQQRRGKPQEPVPAIGTLAYARTCYSHLAGWLGVCLADSLQRKGLLTAESNRTFRLTEPGRLWMMEMGVLTGDKEKHRGTAFARQCPDWTERRPHLAGSLGVLLYRRLLDLRWMAPVSGSRSVRVTLEGKQELWNHLRIPLR